LNDLECPIYLKVRLVAWAIPFQSWCVFFETQCILPSYNEIVLFWSLCYVNFW